MTNRRSIGIAVAVFAVLLVVHGTSAGPWLEDHLSYRLELEGRNLLHHAPPLDNRIEIVAIPELHPQGLTAHEWSTALASIYAHRPSSVIVEYDFSRSFGDLEDRGFLAAAAGFPRLMAEVRVIPRKPDEETASLSSRPELQLENFFGQVTTTALRVPWMQQTFPNLEGPSPRLVSAFRRLGQLEAERLGSLNYVHPLLRIDDKLALPYMGFYSGQPLTVVGDSLVLGGLEIPLDENGRVPVNLPSAESLTRATEILSAHPAPQELQNLHEGDTVFVVPLPEETSSLPLHQRITASGGYLPAAVLSSALTGEWLRPIEAGLPLTFLFCALGLGLALLMSGPRLVLAIAFAAISSILGAISAALALGWMVPWIFPILGLTLTAASVRAARK